MHFKVCITFVSRLYHCKGMIYNMLSLLIQTYKKKDNYRHLLHAYIPNIEKKSFCGFYLYHCIIYIYLFINKRVIVIQT
jgi:hypothetical protein